MLLPKMQKQTGLFSVKKINKRYKYKNFKNIRKHLESRTNLANTQVKGKYQMQKAIE